MLSQPILDLVLLRFFSSVRSRLRNVFTESYARLNYELLKADVGCNN